VTNACRCVAWFASIIELQAASKVLLYKGIMNEEIDKKRTFVHMVDYSVDHEFVVFKTASRWNIATFRRILNFPRFCLFKEQAKFGSIGRRTNAQRLTATCVVISFAL